MAVQEGLFDLDTPISKYVPDFTVHSRFEEHPEELMTLRHMLSHWAGFTHDPPVGINLDQPGYFERYIERISDTWLRFPVGYRHQYSNYGVDLAGYILQSRSGKPFAEYLQETVLGPIGMSNSSFDLDIVEQRTDRAVGHDNRGVVAVPLPEIAAAGLYSSIRDMSKYVQFHLNDGVVNGQRLLREDLMEQYHSIQFAHRGQRTGYTFGLIREVVSNTFCLYHEGGGRGFGSHMIVYPELGIGAVLLTNREYHGLTGFSGRRIMNAPIIRRYGPIPIADPGSDRMRPLDIEDPRLKPILGRYGDSPGVVVGFENGVLGFRVNENEFFPMTFFDDEGELVGMYRDTWETRFLPPLGNQPGSIMILTRVFSNSNCHYAEFNDSPSDRPGRGKPEWQQYLGEYDVLWEDEPTSTVTIAIHNGYLYFRDGKCEEYEPGLFFLYDGEALDFRSTPPTFATQEIQRQQP
jgi:CubicO group peptidase (beta-lactamase class C family)